MTEKQWQWRDMLRQLTTVTDGLGMPIDKGILETVAILRLLGFNTTMSCWGHLRRVTNGPYIIFTSIEAKKYEAKCREVGDRTKSTYKNYEKKARQASALERKKLIAYLEAFYQNYRSSYSHMLIVRSAGLSSSYINCLGADLASVATSDEKKRILNTNRAEVQAFTAFLKAIYFG